MRTYKNLPLRWIKPIDFWKFRFLNREFDAIILVEYKNPPLKDSYECLHIFRFKNNGEISINEPVADFAFKEFNPERDYKRLVLIEYQTY